MRFLNHILELLVEIGIDRLGRHEHDGGLVGLAGNQIFLRDVTHVLQHIAPEAGFRRFEFLFAAGGFQGIEGFEWKLGIDYQLQVRLGQNHQTVRPRAVAQRALKDKGAGVQPVADDRFHAALAISTARLLVGQDVLERDHLGRQRRQILLRRVDDGETFVELAQRLAGLFRLAGEADSQPLCHLIEPLIDCRGQR